MNIVEYLKSKPVVDIATVKKRLKCSSKYASLVLQRLLKRKILQRVTRNKYTTSSNPYLIATNLYPPSYLSLWSASQYLGFTKQILNTIQVVTTSRRQKIRFEHYTFKFIPLPKSSFFGFSKVPTEEGEIFVAEPEKLIIDALLRPHEMGNLDEIIKIIQLAEIDHQKIVAFLRKAGNRSLHKRIGYLLKTHRNIDLFPELSITDKNYVKLYPLTKKTHKNEPRWRIKQ